MSGSISVRVAQAESLHPLIRRLRLEPAAGGGLPGFSAGAHVRVQVTRPDGRNDWRHYSLINPVPQAGATTMPTHYEIAVRLEDAGQGGSRFMHGLVAGDLLTIEAPKNDFPLRAGHAPVLLVAGGIGVTPLISMAAELRAAGRQVRMVYAGRSGAQLVYMDALRDLLGENLGVHIDDEAGAPLDVAKLLDGCAGDEQNNMCGPKPMLDAVLAGAQARGWDSDRVRFELFSAAAPAAGDQAFDVVLAQSGVTYRVAADQSILDCLIGHGCDPLYDCRRGECGVCAVPVIEGDVEHRDHVLSASEKAASQVIQICVSRARGHRLVVDL